MGKPRTFKKWPESYFMKVGSAEGACQGHIRACYAELDKLRKVVDAARAQHTPHHSMPCAVCAALADLDKGE